MMDLHVHTRFSRDSDAKMEGYVNRAVEIGLKTVCFTDHVDYNPNDYGYRFYQPEAFFEHFYAVRSACRENLDLYAGIEFGDPHLYADELAALSQLPYDFVIGSIHWVGNLFPCQKVRQQYSAKEFYTMYWDEVLKTVRHGGFDTLGHIDFPKRYYQEVYYQDAKLKEIFEYLLDRGGVLEINTSSMRKGYFEPMPGDDLLQLYKAVGGKYVTIGSDAHVPDDLGADYTAAAQMAVKLELQQVMFKERKMRIVG